MLAIPEPSRPRPALPAMLPTGNQPAMRRAIVLLLACILMLSHGGMGEAAPHPDGERHSHAVHVEHADDGDHSLVRDSSERENGMGHANHVHVVGDLVAPHAAPLIAFARAGSVARSRSAPALRSRGVAPLLEPPAA